MTEREKKKEKGEISRREFLKDAGLVVGGAAIGSTVLLAACGGEETTKTVTTTAPGGTTTVTTTAGEVTKTVTESKFVCPIDGMEFNSLAELQAHFEAVHGEAPIPAALNVVNLTVNGEQYSLQVAPNEPIRDTLRQQLGLTSIKDMCMGIGACGSCTVIMDGRPILACLTMAIECEGAVIETCEAASTNNPALFDAYIHHFCMQCGYCTPGFFVTAKALIDHKPKPTVEDIRDYLAGNICR
jgi:aerobic-type carbon monoxide dehydrogenase small subunit (CoxS/CutS family)